MSKEVDLATALEASPVKTEQLDAISWGQLMTGELLLGFLNGRGVMPTAISMVVNDSSRAKELMNTLLSTAEHSIAEKPARRADLIVALGYLLCTAYTEVLHDVSLDTLCSIHQPLEQ